MRRTFIAGLALALIATATFAQNWDRQHPRTACGALGPVFMADPDHVWIVGGDHSTLYTSNGGQTWEDQDFAPHQRVLAAFATASGSAWTVGEYGSIRHSTNHGATWNSQHLPGQSDAYLTAVFFLNDSVGWTSGGRYVYSTHDGGSTWTLLSTLGDYGVSHLRFFDALHGTAISYGMVARTSDGGVSWTIPYPFTSYEIVSGDFVTYDHGWIMLRSGDALFTDDGGETWADHPVVPDSVYYYFNEMDFVDEATGWLVGNEGRISHTTDAGITWTQQQNPQTESLSGVFFSDRNTGFAVGEYGTILHTTDGGAHWRSQGCNANLCLNLSDVCFADNNNGWAVGLVHNYGTGFLHTTNAGLTWTAQECCSLATGDQLYYLSAVDASHAWAAGHQTIVHTTDGGASWSIQQNVEDHQFTAIKFIDPLNGWICGGCTNQFRHGFIWHTTDGGGTWTEQFAADSGWVEGLNIIGDRIGWAFTSLGLDDRNYLLQTTDAGQHWNYWTSPSRVEFCQVVFPDSLNGWVAARETTDLHRSRLYQTTDGGVSWSERRFNDQITIPIAFSDALHGWMSVNPDSVSHTSDGGLTWQTTSLGDTLWPALFCTTPNGDGWCLAHGGIYHHSATILPAAQPGFIPRPSSFSLSSFPNPFNPTTTLEYTVPSSGRVSLTICDLTGRSVQTLTDRVLPAGSYRATFNGSTLPSGVYFARLQGKNFSTTQKLMLLK